MSVLGVDRVYYLSGWGEAASPRSNAPAVLPVNLTVARQPACRRTGDGLSMRQAQGSAGPSWASVLCGPQRRNKRQSADFFAALLLFFRFRSCARH